MNVGKLCVCERSTLVYGATNEWSALGVIKKGDIIIVLEEPVNNYARILTKFGVGVICYDYDNEMVIER